MRLLDENVPTTANAVLLIHGFARMAKICSMAWRFYGLGLGEKSLALTVLAMLKSLMITITITTSPIAVIRESAVV